MCLQRSTRLEQGLWTRLRKWAREVMSWLHRLLSNHHTAPWLHTHVLSLPPSSILTSFLMSPSGNRRTSSRTGKTSSRQRGANENKTDKTAKAAANKERIQATAAKKAQRAANDTQAAALRDATNTPSGPVAAEAEIAELRGVSQCLKLIETNTRFAAQLKQSNARAESLQVRTRGSFVARGPMSPRTSFPCRNRQGNLIYKRPWDLPITVPCSRNYRSVSQACTYN
jgi:hypothetical protein